MTARWCYRCQYHQPVSGSTAVSCRHPFTAAIRADPFGQLVARYGVPRPGVTLHGAVQAAIEIGLEVRPGEPIRGWWPIAYEASAVIGCDGFAGR
jgi:hypothetical protein